MPKPTSILADAELIAFVPTTDPPKARAFYEGVLGFRVVSVDQFAIVLDSNGVTIRVATVPRAAHKPASFTILGWGVADIAQTVNALNAKGVLFERYDGMSQDELGTWTSPSGARVAWFRDPDGNVLSVTQL